MRRPRTGPTLDCGNKHLLLSYVDDREWKVDGLHNQGRFIRHELADSLRRIQHLGADASRGRAEAAPLPAIDRAVRQPAEALRDLHVATGYHPAHDKVNAIINRPRPGSSSAGSSGLNRTEVRRCGQPCGKGRP